MSDQWLRSKFKDFVRICSHLNKSNGIADPWQAPTAEDIVLSDTGLDFEFVPNGSADPDATVRYICNLPKKADDNSIYRFGDQIVQRFQGSRHLFNDYLISVVERCFCYQRKRFICDKSHTISYVVFSDEAVD